LRKLAVAFFSFFLIFGVGTTPGTAQPQGVYTFKFRNTTSSPIFARMFSRTRNFVWPATGHYFLLRPGVGYQSVKVSCMPGEKICYGAALTADGKGRYWGAGYNGDKTCTDCCVRCGTLQENPTHTWNLADTGGGGTPPPTGSLGAKIVAYAVSHLGQCVADENGTIRPGVCGPKEGIGPGECTHLAASALASAGARPPNFSTTPYTWGNPVQRPYQPGDIIQFTNTYLQGPGGYWYTDSQHTAIIEVVRSGTVVGLIQQHSPERTVTRQDLDLGWTITRGSIAVFRPVPR